MEEYNLNEVIQKYTREEGGEWYATERDIIVADVVGCPKKKTNKGIIWKDPRRFSQFGKCHSFITESGNRYDAFNHFRFLED